MKIECEANASGRNGNSDTKSLEVSEETAHPGQLPVPSSAFISVHQRLNSRNEPLIDAEKTLMKNIKFALVEFGFRYKQFVLTDVKIRHWRTLSV